MTLIKLNDRRFGCKNVCHYVTCIMHFMRAILGSEIYKSYLKMSV